MQRVKIKESKGYGLLNILFRSTFSLQYGHICFFPTIHHPLMQNSWNLHMELRLGAGECERHIKPTQGFKMSYFEEAPYC